MYLAESKNSDHLDITDFVPSLCCDADEKTWGIFNT